MSTRSAATTCRPADQWPELEFTLPELAYPEQLNCADALLGDTIAVHGAGRPCLLPQDPGRAGLELRRSGRHGQPDRGRADRRSRPGARQPGTAPRAEQSVAGCLLVRRPAGRRRGGRHDAVAARGGADHHLRHRPGEPGPVRRQVHRRAQRGAGAGTADADLRRGRPGRARQPQRTGQPQARHLHRGQDGRRRRRADRVHLGHHRAAQGRHALPPRHPGRRRHLLGARAQADRRRRLHRHSAAGVHVRARRHADLPDPGRRVDAADRAGHARPSWPTTSPRAASRSCRPRRPRTGPCWPRARPGSCAGCAARSRPARRCPASVWQAFYDATGVKIIDGIGSTELLHIFISAADDQIRPGSTGLPVPGYRALVARRRRRAGARRPARTARGQGTDRLPVPGRRPPAQLRQRRLELHRRHLRPRRRRLLLVPGPLRRHDRLGRLQHRRPGGRGRAADASRGDRVRRGGHARRDPRPGRHGLRRAGRRRDRPDQGS